MVHQIEGANVIVGPFTHPSYAKGIELLLSEFETIHVVQLGSLSDVHEYLTDSGDRQRASVVLLEAGGKSNVPPTEVTALIETCEASFVLLDPEGTQTAISVDNPDGERLIRIVQALVAHPGSALNSDGTGQGGVPNVRVLHPNNVGPATFAQPHFPNLDLEPIHRWLTLTLGLALTRLKQEQEQRSVSGWYVSPVSALSSLGLDPDNDTAEQTAGRLVEAERALFGDRSSLPPQLVTLAETFALSEVELRILTLALAAELDGRYGLAVGVLQDDLTRRRPGLTLLTQLLGDTTSPWDLRSILETPNSMVANGLLADLSANSQTSRVDEGIRPTAAVIHYLLNPDGRAAASAAGAHLAMPAEGRLADGEQQLAERLASMTTSGAAQPVINLIGVDTDWFGRAVSGAGIPLIRGDVSAGQTTGVFELIQSWVVLSRLYGSALLLQGLEHLELRDRRRIGAQIGRLNSVLPLVAFTGQDTDWLAQGLPVLRLQTPTVSTAERSTLWSNLARSGGLKLRAEDAQFLAATLPLGPSDIETCVALCKQAASDNPELKRRPLKRRLQEASRELDRTALPPAAKRIDTGFEWDDLVAAEPVMEALRTISTHVAHSAKVFEEWGFKQRMPYGHGLAALFSGPSGTGKTMAARIIAGDLGVDLLQVDLSKTVSKYIGETEKNLDAAFSAAEKIGAVLLFDEADALFGKRTEVKDSHDRHANVEVAYLLQRIEAFPGLAILTSNLKQNIDNAFLRRLRFSVDFPVPNAAEREAIWHRSFPDSAPLDPDLDISFLARRLKLTGGSIQQITLHAAFAASADGQPIGMCHVVAAARQELVKIGMLNTEKSLEGLAA